MKDLETEILIDANPYEIRVAMLEAGRLVEFYAERARDRGITGNVYKGKIVRVLPGMQSAFIEVGHDRTAFLHVTDIRDELEEDAEDDEREHGGKGHSGAPPATRIQDLIKEGQELMVQVAKEPIGTKGARVTSYISLPGRYLVFMPTYDKVAVSRRISSDRERRRLKDIVHELRPPGTGFIVRTVCEGMTSEDVKADMDYLLKLWNLIQRTREKAPTPSLLYKELDLTLRTIRDTFSSGVTRLLISPREEYDRAMKFVQEFMPHLAGRLAIYEGKEDIFDAHGIEIELASTLERKVWLRSGGHIIIDQLEALTAVDVNTGKYVGKKSSEETILKTNLEAIKEIVYQLRLRNIGGIIVIDFIDMDKGANREKVYNELKEALKADKARTNILKVSELGIVEMTRKRTRESLIQSLCEPCPYCDGNGVVKGKDTVVMEIYRELAKDLPHMKKEAVLYVSSAVAERLIEEAGVLGELEKRFDKTVTIKVVERFHQERYEIF